MITKDKKIYLLIRYIHADSARELFGLAEELKDEELFYLYSVTKCEGLGLEIDERRRKNE